MRNRKLEWEVVAAIALLLAMVWPSATLAADPSASLSNPLQVTLTTRVVAGQGLEIKHMVRNVGPADLPTVWLQGEWWRPVEGGSPPPPPTYVWDVGPLAAGAERTLTQLAPCGVTIYARARVVAYSDGGKFTGDAGMQGPFWVACSGGSATCWEAPWLCPGQDEPTLPANYTGLKLEASGVRAGQGYVALEILTGAGWDHRGVAALTHHEVREAWVTTGTDVRVLIVNLAQVPIQGVHFTWNGVLYTTDAHGYATIAASQVIQVNVMEVQ